MNIVYSTDEKYAVHAYISINSLLVANRSAPVISFYLISNGLSNQTQKLFNTLINSFDGPNNKRNIKIIDFALYIKHVDGAKDCGSLSTYGRLFLQNIHEIEKALYIDCDTLVVGDLTELYELNLNDVAVAGVQDIVSLETRNSVGLLYGDRYINAGVTLFNLNFWRKVNGQKMCLDYLNSCNGDVPFHDQGCINSVFKNNIKIIHPKYNLMNVMLDLSAPKICAFYKIENYYSKDEINEARNDSRIIHFTAGNFIRPWYSNSNHPYSKIYKRYRKISPWKDEKMPKFKGKKSIYDRFVHFLVKYCFPVYKILNKRKKENKI